MTKRLLAISAAGFVALFLLQPFSLLAQDTLLYMPFDNDARDHSGYQNHGQLQGNIQFTTDRFGRSCSAAQFDGVNSFIEIAHSNSLATISSAFSAACWFSIAAPDINGLTWLTLLCKGDKAKETFNNPQFRVQAMQSSTQATVSINSEFTEYDPNFGQHLLLLNKWVFFALVYDGTKVKMYLNGKRVWEYPYASQLASNYAPLHVGKDVPGATEMFAGALDDLRLFNYALSDAQVQGIYRANSGYAQGGLGMQCPASVLVEVDSGGCTAMVDYMVGTNNIGCDTVKLELLAGLPSGADFPLGTHQVVYKASAGAETQSCAFKVEVEDSELPVITCRNDTAIVTSSTSFHYALPLPVASDNCKLDMLRYISGVPEDNIYAIGTHVAVAEAVDISGNRATCTTRINVTKDSVPVIAVRPEDLLANDRLKYVHDFEFNSQWLTLLIYDHQVEDNDSISIVFNQEVIVHKEKIHLREKQAILRTIQLLPDTVNVLIVKAWNTGEIFPNTVTVDFFEGELLGNTMSFNDIEPVESKVLFSEPGKSTGVRLYYKQ